MRTACTPSSTRSFRPLSVARKGRLRERLAGLFHCAFSLPFLSSFLPKIVVERSGKKGSDSVPPHNTVEQIVENDYPVPSHLLDVFRSRMNG